MRCGQRVIPARMEIRITGGGDVTLDLTEAEITRDALDIDIQLETRGHIKVRDVTDPDVPALLQ